MSEARPGLLTAFDPSSAELYAAVSADNRLRIWATSTGQLKQQYVEPGHLSKRYTCIAWYRRTKGKRSSSGATKRPPMGMIALGTDKGSVSLWDLKRGAVVHSLGESEGLPRVTSVAFSSDGKMLYSSSSGKDVLEWNVETGELSRKLKGFKHGATKICLHPLGKILAIASSSIRLVDVATGKCARKLSAGHAGDVEQLEFSADGRYLVSSAASSRFANVFDVAGKDLAPDPVATLGLGSAPAFLSLYASSPADRTGAAVEGSAGHELTLVGGSGTGEVCVLRTRRQADGKSGPVAKLEMKKGGASSSVLYACLSVDRPSSAMVLATGSPTSPAFAEVTFADETGSLVSSLSLGSEEGVDEGDDFATPRVPVGPAHVVGPGELGIRGSEVDAAREDAEDSFAAASGLGNGGRPLKRLKAADGGSDVVADGVEGETVVASNAAENHATIAERLEALSEAIDEEGKRYRDRSHGVGGPVAAGREGSTESQPRAESLSTVLTQALQSGDESLLEQCLAVADQDVIKSTVERLSSSKVLSFMYRVVAKLEKRPSRATSLGRWIRALLSCHMGYLVSVPGLPEKLALLHQLIDRRVACFPKLLELQGRLDLLLSRAKPDAASPGAQDRLGAATRVMDQPEAVYREEDEDDEEGEGSDDEDQDEGEDGDNEDHSEEDDGDGEEAEEDDDEDDNEE